MNLNAANVQEHVTSALIKMLEVGTKKQVGDHRSPKNPTYPYSIIYSIPGGGVSGPPLHAPEADAVFAFRIRSVGLRRDQTQALADRVRAVMVGRRDGALVSELELPTGWSEQDRYKEGELPGVDVEGTAPKEMFNVSEDYYICVTPVT